MSDKSYDDGENRRSQDTQNALFAQSLLAIQGDIHEINLKLDSKYVTKEEFSTVKSIAYGLVSLIMVSVVGGVMALLFKQ